jgi:type II secretory pathway pseudopilin PulG
MPRLITHHAPQSAQAPPLCGFSLIETLVVITVIIAIIGMTIPAVSAVRSSQAKSSSLALVTAIGDAINQYGTDAIFAPASSGAGGQQRLLWDFNNDGILDGDPQKDDAFSSNDRSAATRAAYSGPLRMLGLTLTSTQIDSMGRIVDAWRQPLRVTRYPSSNGRLQTWSLGPDGTVDSNDDGDDIKPWRTSSAR